MALPTHAFPYHQQQQQVPSATDSIGAPSDSKIYSFDEDNATSILDVSVLDPDMTHNPAVAQYPKESFAHADGMLSPADTHVWEAQYHDSRPFKAEGTPYMGAMPQQQQQQPQQQHHMDLSHASMPGHWSMPPGSGDGTPNTALEMMPPQQTQFDTMHYVQAKPLDFDPQRQHDHHFLAGPQASAAMPAPMSGNNDWMALAQNDVEQRQLTKRLRSDSPPRGIYDIRRDAGIQKKNKRIDIPQERNIQTIDQMIENTKDEDLLKELKAQKRLLRNREAALASRQRKKKHTEDLESKEKGHQSQLSIIETQMDAITAQRDELDRQRQILLQRQEEAQRYIEVLQMERRDMLMKHAEETASLRRKVQVLSEQLDSMPTTMSTAPSSTGFTDFNAEMEALHMGHDWENFLFMPAGHPDESSTDIDHSTPRNDAVRPAVLDRTVAVKEAAVEQPAASGLLFMLLLFGAFMASKPTSTVSMNIPADVRAAAPAILKDLLAESSSETQAHRMTVVGAPPSAIQHGMSSRAVNRLTQMHRSLTAPTFQQKVDHAFSLTTAQYASLSNADMQLHDHASPVPPRRTLAQALAESRLPNENKADIYTRSLLWEQIPTEVVNQFKELVRDHDDLMKQDNRQQQSVYHEAHI